MGEWSGGDSFHDFDDDDQLRNVRMRVLTRSVDDDHAMVVM